MMKLGITGTRYGLSGSQRAWVFSYLTALECLDEFHHGDCIGVDVEVAQMVRNMHSEATIISHPPEDNRLRGDFVSDEDRPRRPYLDRNKNIVHAVDQLIACPKEYNEILRSGTWSTVRYARKHGVPILVAQR